MRYTHTISGTGNATGAIPSKLLLPAGSTGELYGVELRLSTGASVTSVTPYVWDGADYSAAATVPDERRLYELAAITSGLTASATDRFSTERFEREGFRNGLTPAVDVAATGAWVIEFTVIVQPQTIEG